MAGDIQQTNSEILNTIIKLCETHADYHEIMKKNFHLIEQTTLGNFNFILYISPSDATEIIDLVKYTKNLFEAQEMCCNFIDERMEELQTLCPLSSQFEEKHTDLMNQISNCNHSCDQIAAALMEKFWNLQVTHHPNLRQRGPSTDFCTDVCAFLIIIVCFFSLLIFAIFTPDIMSKI